MQIPARGDFSLKKQLGALQSSPARGPHHELRSRAPTPHMSCTKTEPSGQGLLLWGHSCQGGACVCMDSQLFLSPMFVHLWASSRWSLQLQQTVPSEQISPEIGSSIGKENFTEDPGNHNTMCVTVQVTRHRNTTWASVFLFLIIKNIVS